MRCEAYSAIVAVTQRDQGLRGQFSCGSVEQGEDFLSLESIFSRGVYSCTCLLGLGDPRDLLLRVSVEWRQEEG